MVSFTLGDLLLTAIVGLIFGLLSWAIDLLVRPATNANNRSLPVSAEPGPRTREPPLFGGKSSEFFEWVLLVERSRQMSGKDGEAEVIYAAGYLTDNALRWFLLTRSSGKLTFFQLDGNEGSARESIWSFKQREGLPYETL